MAWHDDAQQRAGVPLHHHSHGEWHGPCPECGGTRRFIVWQKGNFWCRECGHRGMWADVGDVEGLLAGAEESRRACAEVAAQHLLLHGRERVIAYHNRCLDRPEALEMWLSEGIGSEEIRKWGLGQCDRCPVRPEFSSLVIPVFQFGHLVDIRHRLVDPGEGVGKYRSEYYGTVQRTFNLDAVLGGDVVVVEGEKKAIVLDGHGLRVVGIPGMNNCGDLFAMAKRHRFSATVALDPDAKDQAWSLAGGLLRAGCRSVAVAFFPSKPDDFLMGYGYDVVVSILKQAMPVRG